MIGGKLLSASAAVEPTAIEDVFSTYLYTGNGSTQTITNGIDLAGEGGLVWLKARSLAYDHFLYDTNRGATKVLRSNLTNAEATLSGVTSFNSNGFSLGPVYNDSAATFASWTFRKAPRFFDVVTYTGNGSSIQQVSHNLDVAPGAVFIKRTDSSSNWVAYTNYSGDYIFNLNNTNSRIAAATATMQLTSTIFTATTGETDAQNNTNINGATYVAYLFAHDPLGPSGDGSDGLIACGSYTGNGSTTGPVINLGWEPQWILVKNASASADWLLFDNMRGVVVGGLDARLIPNTSNSESSTVDYLDFNATGFQLKETFTSINASGNTYIYIAIRRGPMREPTVGTQVFAVDVDGTSGTPAAYTSGFPVDLGIYKSKLNTFNWNWNDRLRGQFSLSSNTTAAEAANSLAKFDDMDGWADSAALTSEYPSWMFRRAPGFFDVVAYTGDGATGRSLPHNLGVAPELMIFKVRNSTFSWAVSVPSLGANPSLLLNSTLAAFSSEIYTSAQSATTITLTNESKSNASGNTFIAYLFATLPGVSKVGSYTGNSGTQTINCGFTTGARFVMVKAANTTGAWFVWDTARGIVSGSEPYLRLNSSLAEESGYDAIDPDSSGFVLNNVGTGTNDSGTTYIYLAIA